MRNTRQASASAGVVLGEKIEKIIALEHEAERIAAELKAEREAVKGVMVSEGMTRHVTPAGAEAVLIEATVLTFDTEKLETALKRREIATFLPRSADTKALRAAMEADPELAGRVAATFKRKVQVKLEVREPSEAAAAAAAGSN